MASGDTELDDFQRKVKTFFHQTLPEALDQQSPSASTLERAKNWRQLLFDHGLAGLDYPVDCGGLGLSPAFNAVYQEQSRGLVPREEAVFGISVGMALPTIRDHGSDELKQRFIKPGLRGDEIWCQMYSEPGAGSDLASLGTKAVLDGDEWIISGQKVWTSGAQHSDFAILLARTDTSLPKHRGITMFVLPMHQDGVDVRPLVQMTGVSEFNEIFLDEARIPRSWVVGEVNGGWATAVALLAHERRQTGVASMSGDESQLSKAGRSPIPVAQLIDVARTRDRITDATVRQELARLHAGERIVAWLGHRDVSPSIGKLWRTRQGRAAANVAGQLAFPASPAWRSDLGDPANQLDDYLAYHILNCRGMSLGGGTDEIQRNTLGERVLGLPREPGPDRSTPFNQLPTN